MTQQPDLSSRVPSYIHELEDWPNFRWDAEAITTSLLRATRRQTEIVTNISARSLLAVHEAHVQNLVNSAVASSQIEGENPDPDAIRESIVRRIAAHSERAAAQHRYEPGIAAVAHDAAERWQQCLTVEILHEWHRTLFPNPAPEVAAGQFRDGPIRVVSGGRMQRNPTVHFVAPAADRLEHEVGQFLDWFNSPSTPADLRKPARAHLWFVTIHPYDDGNGRITRAITDMALAQCDGTPRRFYSMSSEIVRRRNEYYKALETTQSGSMDITAWMMWFLDCLSVAIGRGEQTADAAISRSRLRAFANANGLNERQVKFIDRLIDGWTGNVTTGRYKRITRCSQALAELDVSQLVDMGVLAANDITSRHITYRVVNLP